MATKQVWYSCIDFVPAWFLYFMFLPCVQMFSLLMKRQATLSMHVFYCNVVCIY